MNITFHRVLIRSIGSHPVSTPGIRLSSTSSTQNPAPPKNQESTSSVPAIIQRLTSDEPLSPLAQRLSDATDQALATGGASTARLLTTTPFSPVLRDQLFAKLAAADLSPNLSGTASAAASLTAIAGKATKDIALAKPWDGAEQTADAVLRMLDDGHKKLSPELRKPVDMRVSRPVDPRVRVSRARDMAAKYVSSDAKNVDAAADVKEKEERRRMFKERFEPGTRALPNSLAGLTSLANERIEEAMARGAFRDIKRGEGVKRDDRVDNPFIDTTEYIMNNMIKDQNLVPPWIDKQQELTKAADTFRTRLRSSWKSHLLRLIAKPGTTLDQQLHRARQNARAEARLNPPARGKRGLGTIGVAITDDVIMKAGSVATETVMESEEEAVGAPMRDEKWLDKEKKFIDLSIENLNSFMRSYNLMAPDLAKKAYFSRERELERCFADVAAEMDGALREEATRPRDTGSSGISGAGLFRLGGVGPPVREINKGESIGLKEMWRDIWGRKSWE